MAIGDDGVLRRRSGAGPWLALALTCAALALVGRGVARDALLTLDHGQREVVEADAASILHDMPGAEPRTQRLRLRRVDEVLVTSDEVAVLQSTLTWIEAGGSTPLSQYSALYGVDRLERIHAAGFGDEERAGRFRPPPATPRSRLVLWDSFHPGPLAFDFEAVEVIDAIPLHRYRLVRGGQSAVDATAGFARLPLVPERYQVRAEIEQASLLVEPRTGRVVHREQRGRAWYVTADDPTPLGDAHRWSWRYSPEDRARLIAELRATLRALTLVESLLPAVLLGIAALAVFQAWRRRAPRGPA